MYNLYFLAYDAGRAGEFLANLISQDKNFHKCSSELVPNNRYLTRCAALEELDIVGYRNHSELLNISRSQRDNVDNLLETANIIAPTHYVGSINSINLSNLKPVFMSNSQETSAYFEILVWIKCNFSKLPHSHEFERFVARANVPEDTMAAIRRRGFVYEWEVVKLTSDPGLSLEKFYNRAITWISNLRYDPTYKNIDVGKLLFNPEANVELWQQTFNMAEPLPVDKIREYHNNNVQLIEKEFGLPYYAIMDNWKELLWQYIERKRIE